MTSLSSIALLLLSPALMTALLASPQSPKPKYIKLEEEALRKRATKTLMPRFPRDAKKHGASGLAVAEVEIDEKGKVASIKVTEAPDELIRAAVADAVNQWRF